MLKVTIHTALLFIATLQGATAAPIADAAPIAYPDFTPGPGLPSLEELGLKVSDLYKDVEIVNREVSPSNLLKRFDPICRNQTPVNRGDAIACRNYLQNLGTTNCVVSGDNVQFCRAGSAAIWGSNIRGGGAVSSYCRDVASGATWVLDNCSSCGDNSCNVQGAQAAGGNGDLIVTIAVP